MIFVYECWLHIAIPLSTLQHCIKTACLIASKGAESNLNHVAS